MSNLTRYPLIDDFDTTLSQAWSGGTGAVYLNDVPGFTFPASTTTCIVVNPGKSNMQVAEINALDSGAGTVTVSDISINKGASVAYTQQSHAVGSVVRISNNYQFWSDLVTAVNTKVDGDVQGFPVYADDTARDAAITSPTNGMVVYNTTDGALNQYIAGAWTTFATGSVVNATAAVAGKVELATSAEVTAGTATGGTGASLVTTPDLLQASTQSGEALYAGASAVGTDAYAVTMTPTLTAYTTGMKISFKADVANTGACTIDVDSLGVKNIKTIEGNTPSDDQIIANQFVDLIYDGTDMIIQNPHTYLGDTNVTCAETIAAGDVLRYGISAAGETVSDGSILSNGTLAASTADRGMGQKITPATSGSLTSIKFRLRYPSGVPNGTATGYLVSTDETTLLDTSTNTLDLSTITGSYVEYTWNFSGGIYLEAGQAYHIYIKSDATSTEQIYFGQDTGDTGLLEVTSADAISVSGSEGAVFEYTLAAISETTTKVYKAEATTTLTDTTIGIAAAAGVADDVIGMDVLKSTNVGTLAASTTYYLSNTAGEIATSAGNISKVIGTSLATTILAIKNF